MVIHEVMLGDRPVGGSHPVFVLAEAGVNHNGSLEMAYQLVDAAAASGADSVKFQTFNAEKLVTRQSPKAQYQLETTDQSETQYEMLKKLQLEYEDFRSLATYCKQKGIIFLSTPFDEESADFLDQIGVVAFKIGSGELTNLPLLRHIARKGKPIIVSTGMAWLGEVETAIQTILAEKNQQLVVLHCVSNYPADPKEVNLRAMRSLENAFGFPVGFSDHTQGIEIPLAAAALGACLIEKHFTLDRSLPGPDHRSSLEPGELGELVRGIRKVELALGDGVKRPSSSELNTASVARKSIVAAEDIPAGTVLTSELITLRRPGTGLPASLSAYVLGRVTRGAIAQGQLITFDQLS
jgi:N,N'-diacetyllegionaminate synthase